MSEASFALETRARTVRRRLSPQAYRIAFQFLEWEQNGLCAICGKPGIEEIDHKNGDPGDNRTENLQGTHKSCNVRQRNLAKSADSVNVRERFGREESAEIEINRDAEPRYRKWLYVRTEKKEPLYTHEAVYGGAEVVGVSPITSRRYLGKATSPQGTYFIITVKDKNRTLKQVIPR